MMINQTIEKLIAMHLLGIATALKEQISRRELAELSFDERLGLHIDRKWTHREEQRLQRRLKSAKLK